MPTPSTDELRTLFRNFQPLPERAARNAWRLRMFVAVYVTVSSFLVALSLVAGVWITVFFLAGRLREEALFIAVAWLTHYFPHLILGVWLVCAPLFLIWCVRTLRAGEIGVLLKLHAVPMHTGEHPQVKSALHQVCLAAGATLPRLAVIDDDSLNAFVLTHRSESAWIGVTRGLATTLTPAELRCVLAHLVARIEDGSARTATVLAELFAAASGTANAGDQMLDACTEDVNDSVTQTFLKGLLSPLTILYGVTRTCLSLTGIIVLAGYRTQQELNAEYADAAGMLLMKDPEGMMGALKKVLPADNRPGSVFEAKFREDIFGALFFAWPTFSFDDDPELVRIRRMREVLGPAAL